jgi:ankyrin repeat and IBR domain-containing protein 1
MLVVSFMLLFVLVEICFKKFKFFYVLLIRTFLNDLGGNPNKKNSSNETSLHMACNLAQQKSLSAQERRAACVMLLLQWRGVSLSNGDKEKISLTAIDQVKR